MILTEAKRRAQREFEDVLKLNGLTLERAGALLESFPEMKRATYRVPRHGAAGTAANLVLHLVDRVRRSRDRARDLPRFTPWGRGHRGESRAASR